MAHSQNEILAELHRTRMLFREVLEALLDDGWDFVREGPVSEWFNEEMRRQKVEA